MRRHSEHCHVIHPGDIFVAEPPTVLRTLLGSCVAITLWDPVSHAGGMCHFLLAEKEPDADPWILNGRYADDAVLLLIEKFQQRRIPMSRLQAKLFGGSSMMPDRMRTVNKPKLAIGKKNIAKGRAILAHYGLPILGSQEGDIGHRQIELHLETGEVHVYHSETKVIVVF